MGEVFVVPECLAVLQGAFRAKRMRLLGARFLNLPKIPPPPIDDLWLQFSGERQESAGLIILRYCGLEWDCFEEFLYLFCADTTLLRTAARTTDYAKRHQLHASLAIEALSRCQPLLELAFEVCGLWTAGRCWQRPVYRPCEDTREKRR